MQNVYKESLTEWKDFFKSNGESETIGEIKKRITCALSSKPYKSDIKDCFIYEIINSADISNDEDIHNYVMSKLAER